MTVYKPIRPEAEAAAVIAYHLAKGEPIPAEVTGGKTVNNGKKDVPAVLLSAKVVTRDNVKATVVSDVFGTTAQICARAYERACKSIGLL
jgi:D-xylose transport system substrate-binding protein